MALPNRRGLATERTMYMPGVAKKRRADAGPLSPVRVGQCLRGLINGDVHFRVTRCRPERLAVKRRPGSRWLDSGMFCRSLLDE